MTRVRIHKLDWFKIRLVLIGAPCMWLGLAGSSAAAAPLFLPVVDCSSGGSFASSVATSDVDGDGVLVVIRSGGDDDELRQTG